ncbi:DNA/RNA nuclease SfsA [Fodinicurvata sp. EGI_FJ10296]|uniref:DNA/RNA nuclease SfsA n=1 Tax=Fodinicurvata sp. EGI_FJ10296 TaxID=3231908 RepID=UPI0034551513
MNFPAPLIPGRLQRRYKRFLADVTLDDGRDLTVHCPNPGAMLGLAAPGLPVWISESAVATRKYPHTLELVDLPSGLVGVNTGLPNRLAAEAIAAGTLSELSGYATVRHEVKYGTNSRVDLVLSGAADAPAREVPDCYVEVKNVHLRREDGLHPTAAEFPDCVTARGTRHLRELAAVVAGGGRAVMCFIVQRMDCDHFRPAADIDPVYAATLSRVAEQGVEIVCYACRIAVGGITVDRRLPVVI